MKEATALEDALIVAAAAAVGAAVRCHYGLLQAIAFFREMR